MAPLGFSGKVMNRNVIITGLRLFCIFTFILAPILYAAYQQKQTRNLRVVKEGVLYRSGQMTLAGLKRVLHDYGIRTVITLRDAKVEGQLPPDIEEQRYCKAQEIHYLRISPHSWRIHPDGTSPADPHVAEFLRLVRDPKRHPILLHCFAGKHRSGAYSAIYRMEEEGWTNESAIAEIKALGYVNLDKEWDILGYLTRYGESRQNLEEASIERARED